MGEKPFDRVTGFLEAENRVISLARSAEDRPAFFAAFRQLHEEHCARGLRFSPYAVERMTPQTILEKGIGVRPRPLFRLDRVRCANGEQAAVAYVGDTCSEAGTLTMALSNAVRGMTNWHITSDAHPAMRRMRRPRRTHVGMEP